MLCRGWAWLILRFRNPLTVIWRMGCRERAEEGDKLEGIWPLPDTRCHQGWIHEHATCAVTQGPALQRRFGLMLCFCYLEILSFCFCLSLSPRFLLLYFDFNKICFSVPLSFDHSPGFNIYIFLPSLALPFYATPILAKVP